MKIKRSICRFVVLFGALSVSALGQLEPRKTFLPVKFEQDRIFVSAETESGESIVFYTDTGGGLFIYKHVAERLRLLPTADAEWIHMPKLSKGSELPSPLGSDGKLYVFQKPEKGPPLEGDGMLGQHWFADRIWTFDYPGKSLILWDRPPAIVSTGSRHRVALGFKADMSGKRVLHFPRVQVEIDGERLDVLFDTGAVTFLQDEAIRMVGDMGPSARATSFITASTFEKWRKRNPHWRVIEKAELGTGEAMIEARGIRIAGHKVGKAWFTRRPDKNFHEFMSGFMDKKVEGAIGGNVLRAFRVTVDYPNAVAVFERR